MQILHMIFFMGISCSSCPHDQFPRFHEISCHAKPSSLHGTEKREKIKFQWGDGASGEMQRCLENFEKGSWGGKAKKLHLKGLSAKEIHVLLLKEGFAHQRFPLVVSPRDPNLYWLKDGSQKKGLPSQDSMLPMDVYDHSDGSVVRVKAWGIPDPKLQTLRPEPHVSKSVVFRRDKICSFLFFHCHLSTTWENEAFKVNEEGDPLPKSPLAAHGMNFPENLQTDEEKRKYVDNIMEQAHTDLPMNWDHCPPENQNP